MCGGHSHNCIRIKYTTRKKTAAAQESPDVKFSAQKRKKLLEEQCGT
jgi:hypothetical protein